MPRSICAARGPWPLEQSSISHSAWPGPAVALQLGDDLVQLRVQGRLAAFEHDAAPALARVQALGDETADLLQADAFLGRGLAGAAGAVAIQAGRVALVRQVDDDAVQSRAERRTGAQGRQMRTWNLAWSRNALQPGVEHGRIV